MKLTTKEMIIFGILGGLIYSSKLVMELLPNVNLVGAMVIALTVVYRKKALYPIYTYVFILGMFSGFALWWLPYLYIWTILWGAAMLLPQNMPKYPSIVVYCGLCSLFGFCYGTLYAPANALLFGLGREEMLAWIIAGFPFDIIHGVSNIFCGLLILPMISALRRAESSLS